MHWFHNDRSLQLSCFLSISRDVRNLLQTIYPTSLPPLLKQNYLDDAQELYSVMCANRDAAVATSLPGTFCDDLKELVCDYIDSPFEAKEVGFYLISLSSFTIQELRTVRKYARWTLNCYEMQNQLINGTLYLWNSTIEILQIFWNP